IWKRNHKCDCSLWARRGGLVTEPGVRVFRKVLSRDKDIMGSLSMNLPASSEPKKRGWVKPEVKRLKAGSAESQRGPRAAAGGGRYSLVADVRLDNRAELAASLGLQRADALADSAILAASLERWGEDAPRRLIGDFAFAWFDREDRRLLLARDALGQRPLFWHRQREFVAFASMPRGLHALGIRRSGDEQALTKFL